MIKWIRNTLLQDEFEPVTEKAGQVVTTEDAPDPHRFFLWADEFEPVKTSRVLNTMGHPSVWKFVPENYDHFVQ
jgi:hypothetical protein